MSAERCLPISFMDRLVPRILDGSKTQTRRLMGSGDTVGWGPRARWTWTSAEATKHLADRGPYKVGELRWVRESYALIHPKYFRQEPKRPGHVCRVQYLADGAERMVTLTEQERAKLEARRSPYTKPQPGRFLYRSCARIFLRVTSLRAERLQDITEEDARAEGVLPAGVFWRGAPTKEGGYVLCETARGAFLSLWDWVHRSRPDAQSKANPWLWVPGFQLEQVLVRGEGRAA